MKLPRALCQPDANKSCGACCGMYNVADTTSATTMARIQARTEAFHRDADIGDASSLQAFRAAWEPRETPHKLLSGLPNCPFLGFVGQLGPAARVGCMVHPLQNDGVDGRDCGVYDRHICEDYLCAAHDLLTRDEKRLILAAVHDSYLYGLVITNVRLTKELLKAAASLCGAYPTARHLQAPAVVEAAGRFYELMRDWPFRARDGVFGQIVAGQDLDTSRRAGPSEGLGIEPDAFEGMLTCLGTEVGSLEELAAARALVACAVMEFADALESYDV